MRPVLRRFRANAPSLGLLALLALAAALLLTATPHLANRYTDQGLRDYLAPLSYEDRDVTLTLQTRFRPDASSTTMRPNLAGFQLDDLRKELVPGLRDRIGESWYSTQIGPLPATSADFDPDEPFIALGLRDQSAAEPAVRMVAGHWPVTPAVYDGPTLVAVSAAVAEAFHLRVGSRVRLANPFYTELYQRQQLAVAPEQEIEVVGVFEPLDPNAGVWAEQETVLKPFAPVGSDPPVFWRGILLTDARGMSAAAIRLHDVFYTWRYRIAASALTTAELPALTTAVVETRRLPLHPFLVETGLDSSLSRYAARVAAVRAVLAVVQAGIVATLFGLVLLAAAVAAQRRRAEFALLRARGSSLPALGTRMLAETAVAVVVGVGLGYLLGRSVPGRPGTTDWTVLGVGAAAMLAAPVLVVAAHRGVSFVAGRSELGRPRRSARRVTAELTLVVVAALGVYLIRKRSLAAVSDVDPFLSLVPVLLAAAAAVLTLRVFPYPLRLLAAGARRARGAVPFLGLARAGRSAPASAGPLAVLVVAVSVGLFSASVVTTTTASRDLVADLAVPGDAFVHGGVFALGTADRLAAQPGVRVVAPVTVDFHSPLTAASGRVADATAYAVDGPALAAVLAASGVAGTVPAVLTGATRGAGTVPALVSPSVAATLAGTGTINVSDQPFGFTVVGVVATFPGLPIDSDRFVVLPSQALPATAKPVLPNGFVIAGNGFDPVTLAAIGDQGQRDWFTGVTGKPSPRPDPPSTVAIHRDVRAALDQSGVDGLLTYTFTVGAAGSVLLALLAVGFAVTAGARARGRALSRLRTMGLSSGQGRHLLAYEIMPLVALGAVVGAVVGVALPGLIGPALGLSAYSGGAEAVLGPDPRLALATVGLVLVAVGLAVVVEAMMNRRHHLGEVLRVGGDS